MNSRLLWPTETGTPGALDLGPGHSPSLVHFPAAPDHASARASVLVLPGGGYGALAEHEGAGYARWFAEQGLHAAVLDYRLGTSGYRHPAMLQDAARALRTLRHEARAAGRDPQRIAVIGSSAGGHLAATLSTLYAHSHAADPTGDQIGRESARPDASILCYPVISLDPPFTHAGSRENLLGPTPDPDLVALLSPARQITSATPPAFLWHTADDTVVPVENALLYAQACWRAGVSCELHVYPHGKHGLGLGDASRAILPWPHQLAEWLKRLGWR